MNEAEQRAEDLAWLEGEATAEKALAERLERLYTKDADVRRAIESYNATAARFRRILSYIPTEPGEERPTNDG